MAFKFVVFAACLAAANAGFLSAPAAVGYAAPAAYGYATNNAYGYAAPAAAYGYAAPAAYGSAYGYAAGVPSVSSVSQNTLRSFGNTAQVSTYSKALDTPYSSVRKSDVRVTNDARAYGYAAPAAYGYAAPAAYASPIARVAAPLAYSSPIARVASPLAYSAPAAYGYASPAASYGYAAPAAYGSAYGYAAGVPSVSSVSQNTLRSYGNTAQVSTYSKALDTPYSSVRKSDVRVTNDARAYGYAAPAAYGYASPAAAYGYAAPAAYHGAAYAAPIARVAAHGALGVAYSAAPVVSTMSYSTPLINYAY